MCGLDELPKGLAPQPSFKIGTRDAPRAIQGAFLLRSPPPPSCVGQDGGTRSMLRRSHSLLPVLRYRTVRYGTVHARAFSPFISYPLGDQNHHS